MKILKLFASILLMVIISCTSQKSGIKTGSNGNILWGSSVGVKKGVDKIEAIKRIETSMGRLEMIRAYADNGVVAWPDWLPKDRSVYISFKLQPKQILNGSNDKVLTDFFNSFPTNHKIWWGYFHEPEDNIKDGSFTAAEYRQAFEYVIRLQKKLNKPNLIPTLTLMSYSLKPESNRNWKDYVPKGIECMAWDGYYRLSGELKVDDIFAKARQISVETGIPWAVAETGVNRNEKSGRVEDAKEMLTEIRVKILTMLAEDLSTVKPLPQFVCYFNSKGGNDPKKSDWPIYEYPELVKAWKDGQKK